MAVVFADELTTEFYKRSLADFTARILQATTDGKTSLVATLTADRAKMVTASTARDTAFGAGLKATAIQASLKITTNFAAKYELDVPKVGTLDTVIKEVAKTIADRMDTETGSQLKAKDSWMLPFVNWLSHAEVTENRAQLENVYLVLKNDLKKYSEFQAVIRDVLTYGLTHVGGGGFRFNLGGVAYGKQKCWYCAYRIAW